MQHRFGPLKSFRHAGRDYRLTDVHAQVVQEILG